MSVAVAFALVLALSGGSDSPTPYTVDGNGITLPAGYVFEDNGHVNIVSSAGGKGIHFESRNNQPSGEWIGKTFLPWSAFGLQGCDTVTWVQVAQFNEHYGEGGQPPVVVGDCNDTPGPELTPDPEPEERVLAGETFACDFWTYWSRVERLTGGEWVTVAETSSKVPTTADEQVARGCLDVPVEEFPPALPLDPPGSELAETGLSVVESWTLVLTAGVLIAAGMAGLAVRRRMSK